MLRTNSRLPLKASLKSSMARASARTATNTVARPALVCSSRYFSSTRQANAAPSLLNQKRPTVEANRLPRLQQVRGYAETVNVPEMAESITEGTLARFEKQIGDFAAADEEVATIETDKIDVSVNAPFDGTITEFLANPEDTVEVGQPLFKMEPGEGGGAAAPKKDEGGSSKQEEAAAPKKEEQSAPAPKKEEKPAPAPKKEEKPAPKKESSSQSKPAEDQQKTSAGSRSEHRVKMNRMRLRIAERLKESQNTAASLTTFNEVDMSSLLEMRKLYKDEVLKKTGIKFGFMGAFAKASCLAMKEVPNVNAAIEGPNGGDTIAYRDYVDISVAVATPKGLVTPVVRNAEAMDVVGIESEIANLSEKARDNKLTLEDMAGGTFTISNGGVFGSLYGTPIINTPQSAVLGLHGVKERAVVVNGQVVSRPMMYLALTYDHRLLDGREAVIFLRTVKELIEDPRKMLLY